MEFSDTLNMISYIYSTRRKVFTINHCLSWSYRPLNDNRAFDRQSVFL